MLEILPMRKVTTPIILKNAFHPFDLMKDLKPKKPQKILLFRCGNSGNPNPSGEGDKSIFKKPLTPEQIAQIKKLYMNNIPTNDYLTMMNYSKNF